MLSYFTDEELAALSESSIPADDTEPWFFRQVTQTTLSIARHYGGVRLNGGTYYRYIPESDELIRGDVLEWVGRTRREKTKQRRDAAKDQQGRMF